MGTASCRPVPAPAPEDVAYLTERYGVGDGWPVFAETFTQWVIEDQFVAGRPAWEAVGAQFAYMVLFSYSFFIDGYSGLTIAIGSVLTLAFLMATTAKIDWSKRFGRSAVTPPAIPAQ